MCTTAPKAEPGSLSAKSNEHSDQTDWVMIIIIMIGLVHVTFMNFILSFTKTITEKCPDLCISAHMSDLFPGVVMNSCFPGW